VLKFSDISEDQIEKWQSIATYIVKEIDGTTEISEKKKILLAGLDNAGKTAILNILTKRFKIANLQPTKNVDVAQLTSENITFNIWDMGGQEEYRKNYIAHPERFFVNVQSVIYVIDVQDNRKYDLSVSYLKKVLDILKSFEEFPDFFVFLHKADPQIYDNIKKYIGDLEDKLTETFKQYNFSHRIFHTSIYNTILTETNILDSLSNLFELTQHKETPPIELNLVQTVYDNFISFSYVVEEKFQHMENRMNNVEMQNRNLMNALGQTQAGQPISAPLSTTPSTSPPKPPSPVNARQALNDELKKLFRKRK
jgi:small GTP-binding protein